MMTRALVLLAWWQIKNSLRSSLRRPIVWAPLLLAGIFLPLRIDRLLSGSASMSQGTGQTILAHGGVVQAVTFLALVLLALGYADRGLSGGAFTFDPADVAFLFSAPVPRRLLLLFKLPAVTFSLLGFVTLLAWQFRLLVWIPTHAPGMLRAGGGWAALGAAALCVGGYLHVAMTLDVAGSTRRPHAARRIFLAVCVAALAAGGWFVYTHGLSGLVTLGTNTALNALFFPCALAANAATLPLRGQPFPAWGWPVLLAWYGGTLALLLTRRDNYYEAAAVHSETAARVRQAYRAGDWAGARTARTRKAGGRPALSVRRFGTGAGALWAAHLSAALKRPALNVFGPALAGAAFVIVAVVLMPRLEGHGRPDYSMDAVGGIKTLLQVVTGYYVLYAVNTLAVQFYRRSLGRESFGRTLPVPLPQVVLADTGVRAALGSLFPVAEGLTLLLCRVPDTAWTGLALLAAVPAGVFCLNVLSYRLALAYPNGRTGHRASWLIWCSCSGRE